MIQSLFGHCILTAVVFGVVFYQKFFCVRRTSFCAFCRLKQCEPVVVGKHAEGWSTVRCFLQSGERLCSISLGSFLSCRGSMSQFHDWPHWVRVSFKPALCLALLFSKQKHELCWRLCITADTTIHWHHSQMSEKMAFSSSSPRLFTK